MITQLIRQEVLLCNWCACNWIVIPRAMRALLLCCDIIEASQTDTRETHALHKLILQHLSRVTDVCKCKMNSPTKDCAFNDFCSNDNSVSEPNCHP